MDQTLIFKVQGIIDLFNDKQKSIAMSIIIDKEKYKIFESNNIIYIREVKNGNIFNFSEYIKSKCNC